ncbi:MAG: methionine--tRNA ligase [Spirochaetaceae bacterium]|jgi:methionyl-tRNA synthetase|nr:methionine--tRNA ligase [Spirochaetaceae bacterium]
MEKRLITSALPYVNNVPHLGNLIQVLSADCFARFCRLRGYETLYVCGTDEYGTATETRAAAEGIGPRELCDKFWVIHDSVYRWFNIDFDKFGRTSTPVQTEIVQDIFKKLYNAGFITEKTIQQLYCEHCARFLADRYVLGVCPSCGYDGARGDQCESCGKLLDPTDLQEPRCSSCGNKPALKSTKHLYINLPALHDRLDAWIKDASVKGRWARNAVQMTQAWIRDGLHERAITRDLQWGIPVPLAGYENKVFYVWFDAPIGYVSISGCLAEERGLDWRAFTAAWWKNPDAVRLFQFIGKDNIPFHTVIFPSSQLGSGENWTMLHHMSSTEYLNYESGKFSKSKGIGVFGTDVMETGIPSDVWRFYIFFNRPEKSDALFTWKDFGEKVNSFLIGNLGNLVNRTLSFVTRYYGGTIPAGAEKNTFWDTVKKYETAIREKLEWAELRDAFHLIFELSAFANKTFQDGEPWKKRTEAPEEAAVLIAGLCYIVRDLAVMCYPYIPEAAQKIASFFGLTITGRETGGGANELCWGSLGKIGGLQRVVTSSVLFQRLEDALINELREKYSGNQKERRELENNTKNAETAAADKPGASMANQERAADTRSPQERFAALIDLRTAKITAVEKHPKADKLYIINLNIAGEERTIVSGLVGSYTEDELLGKHIVVAYNLKAAKLRGVASRGMLLAASVKSSDGGTETIEVLDAGGAETGTQVCLAGVPPPQDGLPEIDIDTFFSVPIQAQDGLVHISGTPLCINGSALHTQKVPNGEVG